MSARAARAVAAAVAACVALLATACGLPNDASPNEIASDQLPQELFVSKAQTTTTVAPNTLTETLPIWLVQQSDTNTILRPVNAQVQVPDDEDRAAAVVTRLVNRPPLPEDDSLTSAIPQGTMVQSVRRDGGVLEVNLNRLEDVTSTLQRLAVAQIVFTATDVPGIEGVRFLIDGSPTAVPVDQETRDAGSVITRRDFPSLDPAVTTTTTAPPPPVSEAPSTPEAPVAPPAPEAGALAGEG